MRGKTLLLNQLLSAFAIALAPVIATGQRSFDPNHGESEVGGPKEATARHGCRFSASPSQVEIFEARVFDEPLVPFGGEPPSEGNKVLADALFSYANRTDLGDFSSLTTYLQAHPDSKWRGSLLIHLGAEYNNFGYYSKALDAWEKAWKQSKSIDDPKAKAQIDRGLGELARMYSKLGRMHDLEDLLRSVEGRDLEGPGTQLISAARNALWLMRHHPEFSFRCGPLALDRISAHKKAAYTNNPALLQAHSTTNGFSLAQLAALSRQAGMDYQMAYRSPGATFILPAVVHWKVGHFAALLEQDGDQHLVDDYTFEKGIWMRDSVLDEEASGYFLVPPGPLPKGWRAVSDAEARNIWGKGVTSGSNPNGTSSADPTAGGNPQTASCGMASYTMHLMLVDLTLKDTPIIYTPPVGPAVYFTATYNHLEANQPATFSYSNLGPKWTCNWLAYITDNPTSPNADVSFYVDGGGTLSFTGFNPTNQSYQAEMLTQTLLLKTSSSSYEMRFPDGSKKIFGQSDGSSGSSRRVFLTRIMDSAGNSVQLNYDAKLRITNIVDAISQPTTLLYTNAIYPFAITAVMDPFGRAAYFQYDPTGRLTQITDVLGIASQFTYGSNQFINALTTPYGTTVFASGSTNGVTWLEATDPLGQRERLEFNQTLVPASESAGIVPHGLATVNQYLNYRNSFFWDKKAYADGQGDYTKARIYHWLHEPNITTCGRILESVKEPLENRVWFNYPGQTTVNVIAPGMTGKPSVSGRTLDDGTTQLYSYRYNALGNVTNSIDPMGRTMSYIFATNNVDLLEVRMTRNGKNELLSRQTYDAQHNLISATDASGQTTTNTFNARGQLLSTANPRGETTTFSYDSNSYLLAITGPLQNTNDVSQFTYDSLGHVHTVTDTEGYVLTYDYDALNRKTQVTYPDGTFDQFVYDRLDLVAIRDRMNRWTTNSYNSVRQLVQSRDPLGRITRYDWCRCGSLTGLTDPMGRTTTWRYDVQSRPVAKQYVDGSTITYAYESSTSRLKSKRDEKGQETLYEYFADNNLKRVSYPNAVIPTPTVAYTYDPDYNRILTMQDGIGSTLYSYVPITPLPALGAGRLASVSGPLPNSAVSYQYDQLGRVVSRDINGVAQATTFDSLGRPTVVTNALGAFQYSYVNATSRLVREVYPNGQTNLYAYYDNLADQRLQRIEHIKPNGSLLSGFGYGYDSSGQITAWTNQWDTFPERVWLPSYDSAGQLTNVVTAGSPASGTNYSYVYDSTGNRLFAATNGNQAAFNYNALNEIVSSSSLIVINATYEWDGVHRLVAINQGTNRSEFAYDGLGRRVRMVEKQNGAVVDDRSFVWCGMEICEERDSTGTTVQKRFFGQGMQLPIGPTAGGYYYARDHLGSLQEMVDVSGVVRARYDYDPYGRRAKLAGDLETDLGFTGHLFHRQSALHLAPYRAYDSGLGRWLSRDPIGEEGGVNLYAYVGNNPINYYDEDGQFATIAIGAAASVASGWLIAQLTGACYGAQDALTDAALGALEVGLVSKFTKLYQIAKLRSIAAKTGTQLEFGFVNEIRPVLFKGSAYTRAQLRPGEFQMHLPDLGSDALNWQQNLSELKRFTDRGISFREVNPLELGGWLQRERNHLFYQLNYERIVKPDGVFWSPVP